MKTLIDRLNGLKVFGVIGAPGGYKIGDKEETATQIIQDLLDMVDGLKLPEKMKATYDPGGFADDEKRITKRDIEERVWGWNSAVDATHTQLQELTQKLKQYGGQ